MRRDVVVVGASAGGLEALSLLLERLTSGYPGTVLAVLHLPEGGVSLLAAILARRTRLDVTDGEHDQPLRPGEVVVAPPDRHMLVRDGRLALIRGARENRHRPAIDPLFRSAARHYGSRVAAVLLSGAGDDGVAGLIQVQRSGGLALVQDPEEAKFPFLPRAALENLKVDHCLPAAGLGDLLDGLARLETTGKPPPEEPEKQGELSIFTCPTCQGNLWETRENGFARYRCRTGHAFSADCLAVEQREALENSLWAAVRNLEESADLALRMADSTRHLSHVSRAHTLRRDEFLDHARVLRELLEQI